MTIIAIPHVTASLPPAAFAQAGGALAMAGAGLTAVLKRRRSPAATPTVAPFATADPGSDADLGTVPNVIELEPFGVTGVATSAEDDAGEWPRLDLRHATATSDLGTQDLRGADLTRAEIPGVELSGADLRGSCLDRADLDGAQLDGALLRYADLSWTSLREANLSGADCTGARFVEADLGRADLRGTNLTGARGLSGAFLRGARANRSTIWPEGFRSDLAGVVMDSPGKR